jgi:hypothetical protein
MRGKQAKKTAKAGGGFTACTVVTASAASNADSRGIDLDS